mgnify:CR=1 FL=1
MLRRSRIPPRSSFAATTRQQQGRCPSLGTCDESTRKRPKAPLGGRQRHPRTRRSFPGARSYSGFTSCATMAPCTARRGRVIPIPLLLRHTVRRLAGAGGAAPHICTRNMVAALAEILSPEVQPPAHRVRGGHARCRHQATSCTRHRRHRQARTKLQRPWQLTTMALAQLVPRDLRPQDTGELVRQATCRVATGKRRRLSSFGPGVLTSAHFRPSDALAFCTHLLCYLRCTSCGLEHQQATRSPD